MHSRWNSSRYHVQPPLEVSSLSCFYRYRTFDVCAQVDRRADAAESVRTDCNSQRQQLRRAFPRAPQAHSLALLCSRDIPSYCVEALQQCADSC